MKKSDGSDVSPVVSKNELEEKDPRDQQIEELTNNWKRALADYQNLVRRYEIEKKDFIAFASANLILKLLTVLDHLEMAQTHLQDEGLALAIKQFKAVLAEEGLEEVEALGKKFNPEEMEAIEVADGKESGQVTEVLTKGYRLKGKVIRAAKVKVNK